MRSLTKPTQYFIALLFVIQILRTAETAPLQTAQGRDVDHAGANANEKAQKHESFRQANDGDSYEDSDEDDGEDDAEQAQLSLIQQQNQQNAEESEENSDEDGAGGGDNDSGDEARRRRRRRDAVDAPKTDEPAKETTAQETMNSMANSAELPVAAAVVPSAAVEETIATPSLNRTSVLILIRDALKKVTTVLPTESVATNALQYFQLFEHFIQQTIEQVIEDYDEDEEEATTAIGAVTEVSGESAPATQETSEIMNTEQQKQPEAAVTPAIDENKPNEMTIDAAAVEPSKEAVNDANKPIDQTTTIT